MKIHEIFFSCFFFKLVLFFARGVIKGSEGNMKVRYFVNQCKISKSENGFSSKKKLKKKFEKNLKYFSFRFAIIVLKFFIPKSAKNSKNIITKDSWLILSFDFLNFQGFDPCRPKGSPFGTF